MTLYPTESGGGADANRADPTDADPTDADPTDGVPPLCLAVAAYDEPLAEELLNAGADPLRPLDGVPGGDPVLPGGDTPLTRAVDSGCSWMTTRLLPEPVRLDADARAALLARARHWADADLEAELRRRTGAAGPVERRTVRVDGWSCHHERYTLAGQTVWDGHLGVLTALEERFRIRTPFDELLARALTRPDRDHAVWTDVVVHLATRQDDETWTAAEALRDHPDRLRRLFAADVLRCLVIGFGGLFARPGAVVDKPATEVFLPWAVQERDPEVLAVVLSGLSEADGDGVDGTRADEIDAVGLSYVGHLDPRVRLEVPETLRRAAERVPAEKLDALYTLTRDPDAGVRERAAYWLASCRAQAPGITDVLAALLDDELRETRVHAAYGLAKRGDPRCVEAGRRLLPLDPDGWPDANLVRAMWAYEKGDDG
ncbi:HEAT repeat domain-containing protein [Streptomyces sp. 3214.6]|uniref:HEAT repeat domain-containing protein n=1 Tax=Streptomyces sp. 3214.6 TaxID=1882757 RepID=UPI000909EE18|nr:HEAT repeat domain-containing protein [Streptomyces sp. 3214.6]SHI19918.1 HEAT repeat-containing protein [Streptomyces sp. 3214.6]